MNWKEKFVVIFCCLVTVATAIIVIHSLDNKNQPTVTDVMTNNGPTISDFLE